VGVLLGRVFSEGTRPQLPPCEFSFWLLLTFTHLSALFSTGINVPPDITTGCYLILTAYYPFYTPSPRIVLHFTLIPATGTFGTHALL
jgi:hypothetical protein